ncbi:hypothetical protein CLAFUW4_13203 [Fulvia fulva]|uniref:2EXR domain-containing protein n=1 Tax=Passalora fulva TaxID=5499 RepID=A0A9Q8PJC1_PASFU|nr:uncharacterized protein CLAFUR5_13059 [Fulvia fulva]KAK4611930.1 hypothetical protein CLAFUR4_13208 [Fulvia fulva]KAK4612912.1 hypothetical protein CLAFUR0_13212 [Fulvia fulva]UJO23538.1 hypothetical protein CLAFUR5_13059 [Fulvia fulva]WPV21516.1 hypothetical protein CLAFUW4_13203 [Fulvia fulva]WPV35813.1 hypothetical protein CLAFUW7_13211 [Fulvia fulva]
MADAHHSKKQPTSKDFTNYQIAHHGLKGQQGCFKLPAELRNEIYALCLVGPRTIHVTCLPFTNTLNPRAHCVDDKGTSVSVGLAGTLLRTCHEVRDEASPVFYGMNHFSLSEFHMIEPFLGGAGDFVQHIRRITFFCVAASDCRNGMLLLSQAKNLETVTVKTTGICMRPRDMAEALRPLYETMRESSKKREHKEVKEILVLPTDRSLEYWQCVRKLLGDDML